MDQKYLDYLIEASRAVAHFDKINPLGIPDIDCLICPIEKRIYEKCTLINYISKQEGLEEDDLISFFPKVSKSTFGKIKYHSTETLKENEVLEIFNFLEEKYPQYKNCYNKINPYLSELVS